MNADRSTVLQRPYAPGFPESSSLVMRTERLRSQAERAKVKFPFGSRCNPALLNADRNLSQAFKRDEGRCVITGTTDPDVCHIIPFADSESDQYRHHLVGLFHMEAFWGEARCRRLYKSLSSGRLPNMIDTAANMVCLSREVHTSWAQGLLAFGPLETPATCWPCIRLRVRWLERTWIPSMESRVSFSTDPRTVLVPEDMRITRSRTVTDGQVITIFAEKKDQLPNRDILELQWAFLGMHASSGAPDARVYPWHPEEADGFWDTDDD